MRLVSLTYLPELPQRESERAGGECLAESTHTESAVLALSLCHLLLFIESRGDLRAVQFNLVDSRDATRRFYLQIQFDKSQMNNNNKLKHWNTKCNYYIPTDRVVSRLSQSQTCAIISWFVPNWDRSRHKIKPVNVITNCDCDCDFHIQYGILYMYVCMCRCVCVCVHYIGSQVDYVHAPGRIRNGHKELNLFLASSHNCRPPGTLCLCRLPSAHAKRTVMLTHTHSYSCIELAQLTVS